MSKRKESKYKIERRLKVNLWGSNKSTYERRNYRPGVHGTKPAGKLTDYGVQLLAKQKLKGYYGNISERQFYSYYVEASRMRGDTGENLVGLLERRLDAVVYRLKIAPTVFAARQLVSHGHVLVNGKRVTISSYLVKEGDEIEVKPASRQMPLIMESVGSQFRDVPGYIEFDQDHFKGKFLRRPGLEDVPYPTKMEPHLVIEFYSR